MSRRAAEKQIAAGEFCVNGVRAEIGCCVDPETDEITYRGKSLKKTENCPYVVLMLNKPRGYVTTMRDDRGRPCVSELVADFGSRVYPCGRRDMDSEGLLLLTNDGELANKLTHPKNHIPKIYHVRVNCEITPEQLAALGRVDVLMIPVGGFYTIDARQAAELAKKIAPAVTVPMHYRGDGFGYDVIAPVGDFLRLMDNVVMLDGNVIEPEKLGAPVVAVPKCPRG